MWRLQRESVISGQPIEAVLRQLWGQSAEELTLAERKNLAVDLHLVAGMSFREIEKVLGIDRRTARDAVERNTNGQNEEKSDAD